MQFVQKLSSGCKTNFLVKRSFWGWLNAVFNKYDGNRVKEVGPDLAAAEWLIRCGASVKWEGSTNWHSDYNTLSLMSRSSHIQEIDASGSSVMQLGFPYLRGLAKVDKIILKKCYYLEDEALSYLSHCKSSLKNLEIVSCGNISDKGVKSLNTLENLNQLYLFDLPAVQDREDCIKYLEKSLPKCQVSFPLADPPK